MTRLRLLQSYCGFLVCQSCVGPRYRFDEVNWTLAGFFEASRGVYLPATRCTDASCEVSPLGVVSLGIR